MATSIEERILDLLDAELSAIAVGAGDEQTVLTVTRASQDKPVMEFTPSEVPGVQIRHLETVPEPLIRDAQECEMRLELICAVTPDASDEALSDLMADVRDLVMANERWEASPGVFLARRSWITSWSPHEAELPSAPATGVVSCSILYRTAAANSFATKEI
jgi:hypothetical protein